MLPNDALAANFQEVAHSAPAGKLMLLKDWLTRGSRIGTHKNALLTPRGRDELARQVSAREPCANEFNAFTRGALLARKIALSAASLAQDRR